MRGITLTEIEYYDTQQPADSASGTRPLKARLRQRHEQQGIASRIAEISGEKQAELRETTSSELSMASKATARMEQESSKGPGAGALLKHIIARATGIIILAAACMIIYRLKKR